ncbi:MAG TPA: hypothetical protein VGI63_00465 [Verrucomicrobiae bacterium]
MGGWKLLSIDGQYQGIADYLPRQHGNVSLNHQQVLNAILDVAEHGCKWRGPPKYLPVAPPKANRLSPWEYDRVLYRRLCSLRVNHRRATL